jgi:hypothetical protein
METTNSLAVRVECYAGHRDDERPLRFYLNQRCIEVIEIIDQWMGPDYRYFKLRGDDEGIYILRHSSDKDVWEITMFDSGKREETRLSST